ncbi:MAG: TIGR02147 family protein [Bdellovibrionota bacterium]
MNKPIVFEYLDATSFLSDYYKYRKSLSERFSYEIWADELGISSRSFLRLVVLGKKKISDSYIVKLSEHLFSEKKQKEYFFHLVKYTQKTSLQERQIHSQKMITLIKTDRKELIVKNNSDFLSSPNLPRLLVLLTFKDIHPVVSTFARLMSLPPDQIEDYLHVLERNQLARSEMIDGEKHWFCISEFFSVPDEAGSEFLINFHRASLQEAMAAFSRPKDQRRYESVILPLNATEYDQFNEDFANFLSEQRTKFSANHLDGRGLYQMNYNIYLTTDIARNTLRRS